MISLSNPFNNQHLTSKTMAISTLGCKINTLESDSIANQFSRLGWNCIEPKHRANLHIVNSCTVTGEADRKTRQEVRRIVRNNPDAFIVLTGCYAQMQPTQCAELSGVNLVVGNGNKFDIPSIIDNYLQTKSSPIIVNQLDQHVSLPKAIDMQSTSLTRAYLQIQQGCNQGCTFCIIHKARGPSVSLDKAQLLRQVARLVLLGYKEIVICGVDLGSYGQDLKQHKTDLTNLILEIKQAHPELRIRLSSIDPAHISNELIKLFQENLLCPHLHLSLQSADTLILKRMKRRYDNALLTDRVEKLHEVRENLILSADVMTGFPTETNEQHENTAKAIVNLKIAYPHVFVYSNRPGTPAARIPKQVPIEIGKQRAAEIRSLGKEVLDQQLQNNLDNTHRILTENHVDKKSGRRVARAENYLTVLVPPDIPGNELLDIKADRVEDSKLIARI